MRTLRVILAIMLLTLMTIPAISAPVEPSATVSTISPVPGGISLPSRDEGDEDSVYYSYGFEDGWNGWTTVDLTDPGLTWHATEDHAIEGSSFWVGKDEMAGYSDHWLQYLVTPSLNLQGRQNLQLTFDVIWACEDPQNGAPDDSLGYDAWDGCNVWISTNNGESWNVLTPTQPAYNYSSLYSFGYEWNMGHDIPGWCGFSDGAQAASFDLSDYAQANVKIRWAFCSDPAWNTVDDENAIGMVLDNLVIRDANGVVWENNGDALNDMTRDQGPVSGDFWEITDDDAHDGQFSARCPIGSNLQDALQSPAIEIPADGWYTYFDFWVRADTRRPNSNPNEDNSLDDLFEVYVSTNGMIWDRIVYDYGRETQDGDGQIIPDPAWVDEFHFFGPDTTFNTGLPEWKRKLNLTQFAGQEIYLRWKVRTDDDIDGDQGSGIYIDDVRISISQKRQDDVGVEWARIKYPTAVGFSTPSQVAVKNYGMADQARVTKYYRVDNGPDGAIVPWDGLPSDSTRRYGFSVAANRISYADSATVKVHVHSAPDTTIGNDTAFVRNVVFYPANIWPLGYDNRAYTLRSDFGRGSGAAILYTPADDGIRGNFDLKALRVRWNGAQGQQDVQTRLHIFTNSRGEIGDEIYSAAVTVGGDDILPNHHVIDLSGVQALQNMSADFWVWFEILRDDFYPQIIGDEESFGAGHYYTYNGQNLVAAEREWQVHAVVMPAGFGSENELTAGRSSLDFRGVNVGSSRTLRVALFNGGIGTVTVNSVEADNGQFDVAFEGPVTLKIGDMVHAYVTFTPDGVGEANGNLVFNCSDQEPPEVALVASGESVDPEISGPATFGLGAAYPNPFNASTVIPFSLGTTVNVRLAVYDLAGRAIATLVEGKLSAGTHNATFHAGELATGVYLYRLDAGPYSSIRKVVFVK